MRVKWKSKLIVSAMAMLLVYYTHQFTTRNEPLNLVTSVGDQVELLQVSGETHHVVYAQHESGYLVRTFGVRDMEASEIQSIFNALTINATSLPVGIGSLIPEAAELINYVIDDGHLTLNVSREFLEYDAAVEAQLVSSLVWSLTELEDIERVSFQVEGHPVNNLNGTMAVGSGLTRSMGINLEFDSNLTSINDSKLVLLYFLTDDTSNSKLVPVTRLVDANVDPVIYAVESLVSGPMGRGYLSVFNRNAGLVDEPILEEGLLTLNFNEGLFFNQDQTIVSSLMLVQLQNTLTSLEGIESVSVTINGSTRVFDDESNPIAVPTGGIEWQAYQETELITEFGPVYPASE